MICYIGVGSNLGDRLGYIKKAVALLKKSPGIAVKRISPIYETKPQGGGGRQGDYYNCVLKAACACSSKRLLVLLKSIEKKAGRKPRKKRWAAREIDLDILLWGKTVIHERGLKVPHPLMAQRVFVLRPLSVLAPRLRHPVARKEIRTLLKILETKDGGQKIEKAL
jgi:2-amino-4-hydroxy-6-hydroxymethyldihydropteridine diphosphokinase